MLTGEDLKTTGTKSIVDLSAITPNVQIKNVLANSIVNVSIRGIGLNDYAANNNPAAGMYVDNVYLVSPTMLSFGLFDVDRVEVLTCSHCWGLQGSIRSETPIASGRMLMLHSLMPNGPSRRG